MSLCVRRPIQIRREDIETFQITYLGVHELVEDAGISQLYDSDAQRQLFAITTLLCKLCTQVTNTLEIAYSDGSSFMANSRKEDLKSFGDAEKELQQWYEAAQIELSPQQKEFADVSSEMRNIVQLQTNLLWIYYEYVPYFW